MSISAQTKFFGKNFLVVNPFFLLKFYFLWGIKLEACLLIGVFIGNNSFQ